MPNKDPPEIGAPPDEVCQAEDKLKPVSAVSGNAPALAAAGYHCPYIWDEPLPQRLITRIRAHALAIIRKQHAVDDVEQEVKVKLLKMPRAMWDAIPQKEPYVLAIARNVSRDWLRKELILHFKRRSFMDTQKYKLEGQSADLSDPACAVGDLMRILEPFGVECAEAFVRVKFFGHPATTVAVVMNIPVSRVRAHVNRVELHFMTLLEEEPESPSLKSRFINLFKRGHSS